MADDLRNYKLQLQQVEAALLTDPQNEELLKLKTDLEEVIELTRDLIKTQEGEPKVVNVHSSSNNDDVAASLLAVEDGEDGYMVPKWRLGEKCLAKWKADGMSRKKHMHKPPPPPPRYTSTIYIHYHKVNNCFAPQPKHHQWLWSLSPDDACIRFYEATIEDIGETSLKVKFDGYTTLEIISVLDVKSLVSGTKRPLSGDESKHDKGYNREYLKKKKQKKQQRFKQIEEERESEKNKWLSFHSKAAKKPGVRTKSIFASPDNLTGRVGIGTCGISGKPMTEYTPGEKWKKGG